MSPIDLIASSLELPNGIVVPNRLVKVAMEEGIGHGGGLPDARHRALYRRWGEGGWGMIISGNVMVDPAHLATPHCRTIPSTSQHTISAYSALRFAAVSSVPPDTAPPLLLMQISHPGLQSISTINLSRWPWVPAMGPIASRPDTGGSAWGWVLGRALWPRRSRVILDFREWEAVVQQFVDAAVVAERAGWDGVQVHSAHGYLLAEYLSPLTNPDCKPLPGVHWRIPIRLHLIYLVLRGIHEVTQRSFIKAVKINCSDFVQGGIDEKQSADIIQEIISWKLVDVLEVSGGNYSNPAFATFDSITTPASARHATPDQHGRPTRQSLFSHFTSALLPHLPSPPHGPAIILTGGLHSRSLIADSLSSRACDLAGIGRPACLVPKLPAEVILDATILDEEAEFGGYEIPGGRVMKFVLGGGASWAPRATKGNRGPKGNQPAVSTYAEVETQDETTPLLANGHARDSEPNARGSAPKGATAGVPLVGAGISTFWHEWQLCRMGRGKDPWPEMYWIVGLIWEGLVWAIIGAVLRLVRRK